MISIFCTVLRSNNLWIYDKYTAFQMIKFIAMSLTRKKTFVDLFRKKMLKVFFTFYVVDLNNPLNIAK